MALSRYIKVRPKNEDEKSVQIKVLKPRNCRHEETACVECLHQWSWDYEVDVPRNVFVEMNGDGFPFERYPDIRIAGRKPWANQRGGDTT